MSKNAQILLENLIEQEFRNNDNYSNISEYFEFFSASQILKNQGLSDDEVDNGIVGKGLDGGCDSIYLFLNNLLITPDVVEHISAPKRFHSGNDNYPVKEDHIIWRRCSDEVENHLWKSSGFIKNNN